MIRIVRAEQRVLQWFGHVEKLKKVHLVKMMTISYMGGAKPKGRS